MLDYSICIAIMPFMITVTDGVIHFPEGTNISAVKKTSCKGCMVDCTGIKIEAGSIRAEVWDDTMTDQEIAANAPCFSKKES